jgi:hypothetical protein
MVVAPNAPNPIAAGLPNPGWDLVLDNEFWISVKSLRSFSSSSISSKTPLFKR